MPRIARRTLLQSLGAAAGGLLVCSAACGHRVAKEEGCGAIAGRRLRWLVGYGAGGGYDIYSRLIQPNLEKQLGVQIVVENMPGGGGTLSAGTLSRSNPDGLTLGILNGPGLLVASMTGEENVPNPATDLTLLGRIARTRPVVSAPAGSRFQTMEHVLAESRTRPILFSTSEAGSTNFVAVVVTSSLLGFESDFVSGYSGSRESVLACLRGEADLVSTTFESVLDHIEAGDLRPLLQISSEPIAAHPSLEGVALLAGDGGLAVRRAGELGRDVEATKSDARALADLIGTGILVGAPPGLDDGLFRCLDEKLNYALTDAEFEKAAAGANRSLDVARAAEAREEVAGATLRAERFIPIVRERIARLRR
jgi:tripartite-type tricarboxylate transporter receptor subunit TctC